MTGAGDLSDKVVAITGAASGIGRACAHSAAEDGAHVVLIDRAETRSVADEIATGGGHAESFCCDVRNTNAVNEVFANIRQRTGQLDALINCAGSSGDWPKTLAETTDEDWNVVVDTNFKGIFACCRAALPMLRESQGTIVNVASELGLVGTSGLVVYGASKAGVIHLSRGLAVEEGHNRVRVNCVCPGPVDTPFVIPPNTDNVEQKQRDAASTTIMGRLGTPQEIADVVLFVASPKASFMTGSVVVVDGGVTAHD